MGWRHWFRRADRVAESAEELQFYLDAETEDNIARGMPPEEARTAARRKLGNPALIREDVYRMNSLGFLETAWQDIRYSLRTMRKSPLFTLTAVFTLALGIGGNAAVFSMIRTILLKPLDYSNADRLVQFMSDDPKQSGRDNTFTQRQFDEMKTEMHSFSGLGVYLDLPENMTLSGNGEPKAIQGARVSANFLHILGVRPLMGRSFVPDEEKPGGPAVVMISADLWKTRFSGNPKVIGKAITLNSTPYTIIGVLPEGFSFPFTQMDVWVTKPSEWSALPSRYWYITSWLIGFGRLRPGTTIEQASAELNLASHRYAMAHSDRNEIESMRLVWLKDRLVTNVRPTLWILFGVVGFVMLIACANVAGLLLARASSRSREFAVRTALGAPRARLIRQLLVESVVLSLISGLLGLMLAKWALSSMAQISALNLPGVGDIQLDGVVVEFTIALSAITGVLFGLFPSFRVSRPNLADELRESGATAGRGASARPRVIAVSTRGLLVVGQVALSIILLIGAGLLMKSFARLQDVDPGLQPANLLTAKIALSPVRYDTGEKRLAFISEATQRVNSIPGVRDSAIAMSLPTTRWLRTNIQIEKQPWEVDPEKWPVVQIQSVTPGYFRTLEIPIERGREFAERDNSFGAPAVVIINESFARRFWPAYPLGPDPVGQHMREGADRTGWMEIVGIVANVHEGSLAMDPLPEFYIPCVIHPPQTAYLAVRTGGDPHGYINAVRKQVQTIDRDEPLSDIKTVDEVLDATLGQRRLTMLLLGSFAGMALLLAVIGLYGVIAYSVSQRTQELGIRRALGAQQGDILRLVMSQALGLTLAGIVIGIAGAFALTRVMRNLLFQVSATDPATFVGIAFLFLFVALAASYVPARRAARIDPMAALRIG